MSEQHEREVYTWIEAGEKLDMFEPGEDMDVTEGFRNHYSYVVEMNQMNVMSVTMMETLLKNREATGMSMGLISALGITMDWVIHKGYNHDPERMKYFGDAARGLDTWLWYIAKEEGIDLDNLPEEEY